MARDDGNKRVHRVAERIREEIMDMLIKGNVRDPGAEGVVVSAVRVSDDLSVARVFVRLLEDTDASKRTRALDALARASGYLRKELASRLRIRAVPSLRFQWDEVVDSGIRMETLLDEIRNEDRDRDGKRGGGES